MRGTGITRAGEQAIFQATRDVWVVSGERVVFGVSLSLTGLIGCQRTLFSLDVHHHYRSSFRLVSLVMTA
jgi:hypothetical protein